MASTRYGLSFIFIVDPASSIYDDLRERFRNTLKYSVQNYSSIDELLSELKDSPFSRSRTRTLIFVDSGSNSESEKNESINELVVRMKEFDPAMNIIILTDQVDTDTGRNWNFQSSYTLVYKNPNAILKITNLIMGYISKINLERKYMAAKRSVQLLVFFILSALVFAILAYFIFPEYF